MVCPALTSPRLPPVGPLRNRTRRAVQQDERRAQHQRQVGDDAVDVLVELVAAAAQQAVPVLGGHRGPAQVVVLDRGDADDLVGAVERPPEERPVLDPGGARHVQHLELAGRGQEHPRARGHRRLLDAGAVKAALRRLDRVVRDPDLRGARLAHQVDQRRQHLGVGGGAQHRRALEGDVGLDHHDVALLRRSARCRRWRPPPPRTSAATRCPRATPRWGSVDDGGHRESALRQPQRPGARACRRSPSGSLQRQRPARRRQADVARAQRGRADHRRLLDEQPATFVRYLPGHRLGRFAGAGIMRLRGLPRIAHSSFTSGDSAGRDSAPAAGFVSVSFSTSSSSWSSSSWPGPPGAATRGAPR